MILSSTLQAIKLNAKTTEKTTLLKCYVGAYHLVITYIINVGLKNVLNLIKLVFFLRVFELLSTTKRLKSVCKRLRLFCQNPGRTRFFIKHTSARPTPCFRHRLIICNLNEMRKQLQRKCLLAPL